MSKLGDYEDKPFLAALYDLVPQYSERRDSGFYVNFCERANGRILELGCGTGRVLLAIARAGIEVVGLDLSLHMLTKCRENLALQPKEIRDRVNLVQSSMTGFEVSEVYGDFDRSPLGDGSPEMIFVARKSPDNNKAAGR